MAHWHTRRNCSCCAAYLRSGHTCIWGYCDSEDHEEHTGHAHLIHANFDEDLLFLAAWFSQLVSTHSLRHVCTQARPGGARRAWNGVGCGRSTPCPECLKKNTVIIISSQSLFFLNKIQRKTFDNLIIYLYSQSPMSNGSDRYKDMTANYRQSLKQIPTIRTLLIVKSL